MSFSSRRLPKNRAQQQAQGCLLRSFARSGGRVGFYYFHRPALRRQRRSQWAASPNWDHREMDPPKRERSGLLTSIQSRDRSSACPGRFPVDAAFYNTLARGGAKIIECSGIVSFLETASSTAERVGYCPQKIAENSVIFVISETIFTVVYSTEQYGRRAFHMCCTH